VALGRIDSNERAFVRGLKGGDEQGNLGSSSGAVSLTRIHSERHIKVDVRTSKNVYVELGLVRRASCVC
jgi:hypothetical protein